MKIIWVSLAVAFTLTACHANRHPRHPKHPKVQASTPQTLPQTVRTAVPAKVSGKPYVCQNGFNVGIVGGDNYVDLSVAYGVPQLATARLARNPDGSYSSGKGLFGGGAQWQELDGNRARLHYGKQSGSFVSVECRAE